MILCHLEFIWLWKRNLIEWMGPENIPELIDVALELEI